MLFILLHYKNISCCSIGCAELTAVGAVRFGQVSLAPWLTAMAVPCTEAPLPPVQTAETGAPDACIESRCWTHPVQCRGEFAKSHEGWGPGTGDGDWGPG